jgi:hypothetical protein
LTRSQESREQFPVIRWAAYKTIEKEVTEFLEQNHTTHEWANQHESDQ